MKTSDFELYMMISHKIVNNNIKPDLCNVCHPPCLQYIVKLFGKKYDIEFISGNKLVTIQRQYKYDSQIILSLPEIDFYKTHKNLLRK